MKKFLEVAEKLAHEKPLGPKHRNRRLVGNFKGRWECHSEPDWLLFISKLMKRSFLKEPELILISSNSYQRSSMKLSL